MPHVARTIKLVFVTATASAMLAGCAGAAIGVAPPQASTTSDGPVSLTNCGLPSTYDNPQRVVTIKSTTAEVMLALGLGDRIVGMAFLDGPIDDQWTDAAAGIPIISEKVPSEEAVLNLEPDLVYAGWESNFSADGAGAREELHNLGVASYVSPSACQSLSASHPAMTANDILDEITEVGTIFDTDASTLVDEQRAALEAVSPLPGTHTALWFSSGSDTPFVGGGTGAPQVVLDHLGLTNIAGNLGEAWAPFNWESVVDADPDVIVLVDSVWNSVDKKIAQLEGNPATARLTAVLNHHYLVIPFAASEAGVRTIPAIIQMRAQLEMLGLQ